MHYLWLARGNEILVDKRALWRMDRMIFAILINSVTNAIQTSVVRWSFFFYLDTNDIRAARRDLSAGARHDC